MNGYGCLFIDATWRDMLTAFMYTVQSGDRRSTIRDVEGLFGGSERCIACYSVRSALDLFLSVSSFPRGSEILMTAINIPDMVAIVEHHGLTIVPVDVDVDTLCPTYEDLAALVSARTVAVLTAHVYGRWTNMDAVMKIAREHNLRVLEDCAECFSGFDNLGHPQADIAFFSFGAIKYATAMGGAVANVKDPDVLSKMRARLQEYPVFPETSHAERLFRYSIVMFLINNPTVIYYGVRFLQFFAVDYRETIVSLLRGFPGDVLKKLRWQPSTSLLRVMLRQLRRFDPKEHARAKINGDFVMRSLSNDVLIPGTKTDKLDYWLFPILVDNAKEWVKDLEKERIEAYCGVTQLNLVKPKNYSTEHSESNTKTSTDHSGPVNPDSDGKPHKKTQDTNESCPTSSKPSDDFGCINHAQSQLYPHKAKFLIDHVIYLPVQKRVPLEDLERLCHAVTKVAQCRHPGLVNAKEHVVNELQFQSKL